MAVTVNEQSNRVLSAGVIEALGAQPGRKGMILQLQADGELWIKAGIGADEDDGMVAFGWELVTLDFQIFGINQDFLEGQTRVRWTPGGRSPTDPTNLTANLRYIEFV